MVYINTLGFGYFGNFAKPQKGELKAGNVTRKDLPGNSLDLWTLTFMFSVSSEPSPFLIDHLNGGFSVSLGPRHGAQPVELMKNTPSLFEANELWG